MNAEVETPVVSTTSSAFLDPEKLSKPIEALTLSQTLSFDPWASPSGPRSPVESNDGSGEAHHSPKVVEGYANAELDEFDPLADKSKEVEQAWAQVESHPPPPPTPPKDADKELVQDTKESYEVSASSSSSSIPPPPISKDTSSNSSPLTPFRQLSSVARRFTTSASEQAVALTNVPARLLSGSGASTPRSESPSSSTQVTPSTSSTTPRKPQLSQDRQIPEAPAITQTPSSPTNQPSVSATSSNGTTIGDAAPAFDFQKFLDQMKMKNAEPVAKYLRS